MPKPTWGTHFFFCCKTSALPLMVHSVHQLDTPGLCTLEAALTSPALWLGELRCTARWNLLQCHQWGQQECWSLPPNLALLLEMVFPCLFHQCPSEQQRSVARTLQSSILGNTQDEGASSGCLRCYKISSVSVCQNLWPLHGLVPTY